LLARVLTNYGKAAIIQMVSRGLLLLLKINPLG